jgi:hypothetical protein
LIAASIYSGFKGVLVGIRHSAKTSFMPKNVKQ